MKRFLVFLLSISLAAAPVLAEETVHLGGLKGPTTMGLVKLLDDNEQRSTRGVYDFTMAATADELTPGLLRGDLDILAVPANLGAVLYNATKGGVRMAAIGALGVLYIAQKGGEPITKISELKHQTIYSSGKGTTPEMALRHLMILSGMDIDADTDMRWTSEPAETIARLNAQEGGFALLPEPFLTVALQKTPGLQRVLSLSQQWDNAPGDSRLVTAAIVVSAEFARDNPAALDDFLKDYSDSVTWVNQNRPEAGLLIEKYGIVAAAVAEDALPGCNLTAIIGAEMKMAAEGYLQALYDQNPRSVGGLMPGDDFYYAPAQP